MPEPIDFYFDFSSPYGYIAAMRIDDLAARHGRRVRWRPILLGIVFRTTGSAPLPSLPLKGAYALRDFARFARFCGLPYRHPDPFPVPAGVASRAFYWLEESDPEAATRLAKALFRACFVDSIDISRAEEVVAVCAAQGLDPAAAAAGIAGQSARERVKAETDAAIARGVFGSPYVVVDGEPFWGADRLDQVEQWLATGGF